MDLTTNVDLIQRCVSVDVVADCNEGCQWRKGRDSTVVTPKPTEPTGPAPLFTTEFCHPANVGKDTTDVMWDLCIASNDAADCSIATGCIWSDGKELIPDQEFCAPMDLTNDVKLIQKCVSSDSATTCDEGCQWRKGKNDDTKPTEPTGPAPLFSQDFCHPAKVSKDTTDAEWTLCVEKTVATECSITAGCNWSEGKELIPDQDFCAPMDLTTDIQLIKKCVATEDATACRDGCAWRHGTNDVTKPTTPGTPLFTSDFCHPSELTGKDA
jgi:hypothetical protein